MSTPLTPPLPGELPRASSQPHPPLADTSPTLNPEQPRGEAIIIEAPPPSFASGSGVPARIPHIGHALLFVSFAVLLLFLFSALLIGLSHPPRDAQKIVTAIMQPKLLIAAQALAYVTTLIASWFFFPLLWLRPFADGIQWNFAAARRNALKLIPIGLVLGWTVQAISSLIPVPKSLPMDDFFRTPSDVWLVTAFGTLLAPMAEEICFRGFLLSIFFVLLHAEQLAHAWAALFVLFCVSLILTLVRIRTRSVASSALVHATYNLSVFLTLFYYTGGYRHLERMAR